MIKSEFYEEQKAILKLVRSENEFYRENEKKFWIWMKIELN